MLLLRNMKYLQNCRMETCSEAKNSFVKQSWSLWKTTRGTLHSKVMDLKKHHTGIHSTFVETRMFEIKFSVLLAPKSLFANAGFVQDNLCQHDSFVLSATVIRYWCAIVCST